MDPTTTNSFPIAPLIAGAFGLFTGLYLEKFRNRTLLLTHTISFQSLGTEIRHEFWGEIAVSHNRRNIKHLSFVTVTVKNTTAADIQGPIDLDVWVDNRSQFLGNDGHHDTGNNIPMEQNFEKQYIQLLNDLAEDTRLFERNPNHVTPTELSKRLNFLQTNRKMRLVTFNRKSHITINFLIENFDGVTPKVYLSILQKGVKLIPEADKVKAEKTKKIATGAITLLLYISGLIWAFSHYAAKQDAMISTIAIGLCSNLLGHSLYYLFLYLKKILW